MTTGLIAATANAILNALCNNTSFAVTALYQQLHTADPGAAGTTAVATETSRKAVSFGVAATGAISNDAQVQWTGITGSQDASHYSLWDSITPGAGTCYATGVISANAYTAGDTLTFAIGDIDLSFPVAA